jgi:hypothetical protein
MPTTIDRSNSLDGVIGWLDDQGQNVKGSVSVVIDKDGSTFANFHGLSTTETADLLRRVADDITLLP